MTQTPDNTNRDTKFVVGIEIGSSCAKIGIAGFNPDNTAHTLTVYNTATLPTVDSVRYGRITNIREVTDTVASLVAKIDKQYPIENHSIVGTFISIGGRSLKSRRTNVRTVMPDRREITEEIVEGLSREANKLLNSDKDIVYLAPTRFTVDNIPSPRPVGTLGTRLYGEYTAIECDHANKDDTANVISERIGLAITGLSVRPVALARLVLSAQELNTGCMLVDFGAETITVAIFKNSALLYLVTIPMGSRLITRDLANVLTCTEAEAEDLKRNMANAMPDNRDANADDDQLIQNINAVVSARLRDIVANIKAQPEFAGMSQHDLAAGIILTGGGAKLRNFGLLLESRTGMKVRVATLPPDIVISDAGLSTTDNLDLVALLNEAADQCRRFPDSECVVLSPKPVEKDVEVEEEEVVESTQTDEDPVIEFVPTGNSAFGYDPDVIKQIDRSRPQKDDNDDIDVDDDDFDLLDDDERDRRIAAAKKKAEAEKRKKDKEKAKITGKSKPKGEREPSRIDSLITRITRLFNAAGDDESADI